MSEQADAPQLQEPLRRVSRADIDQAIGNAQRCLSMVAIALDGGHSAHAESFAAEGAKWARWSAELVKSLGAAFPPLS